MEKNRLNSLAIEADDYDDSSCSADPYEEIYGRNNNVLSLHTSISRKNSAGVAGSIIPTKTGQFPTAWDSDTDSNVQSPINEKSDGLVCRGRRNLFTEREENNYEGAYGNRPKSVLRGSNVDLTRNQYRTARVSSVNAIDRLQVNKKSDGRGGQGGRGGRGRGGKKSERTYDNRPNSVLPTWNSGANANGNLISKELKCREHLILIYLERSANYFEKNWNVKIELNKEDGWIKLSSTEPENVDKLHKSIITRISNLIKINIVYEDGDYNNLTKKINCFDHSIQKNKNITFLYSDLAEEKVYQIGLTSYRHDADQELGSMRNEILNWDFAIIDSFSSFLLVLNYKPNLDGVIRMHLSKVLNVNEEQLQCKTVDDILVLKYKREISFEKLQNAHEKGIEKSYQLRDIRIRKVEVSNKIIFDSGKLNNTDSIKAFLEINHNISRFNIERIAYGLHVVTFVNRKDREHLLNDIPTEQKVGNNMLLLLPYDIRLLDAIKNVKSKIQENEKNVRENSTVTRIVNIENRKIFYELRNKKFDLGRQYNVRLDFTNPKSKQETKVTIEGKIQKNVTLCVEFINKIIENAGFKTFSEKHKALVNDKLNEVRDQYRGFLINFYIPKAGDKGSPSLFASSAIPNAKELIKQFFEKFNFQTDTKKYTVKEFALLKNQLNDIEEQAEVKLTHNDNDTIELVGEMKNIQAALKLIQNILTDNKTVVKLVHPRQNKYLVMAHLENLENLNEFFQTTDVVYSIMKNHDALRYQCKFSDSSEVVKKIETKIEQIIQKVGWKKISVKPNIYRYFKETLNPTPFFGVENKYQVKINYPKEEIKPVILFKNTNVEMKWYVCTGNIVDSACDVLVSPINENMKHGDGVAKAIEDASDHQYKFECLQFSSLTPLNPNELYITSAGKLPSERVFHVVCTPFNSNADVEILAQKYLKCLNKCIELNYSTIALPLIGAGIYNWPIEVSVNALKKSIEAIKHKSCLKEIYLIEYDNENLKAIISTIAKSPLIGWNVVSSPVKIENTFGKTWYWRDDDQQWKQFRAEFNRELTSKSIEGVSKFLMVIDGKKYVIDLVNKLQINVETNHTRNISDTVPVVNKAQWYWIEHGMENAYNLKNNAELEDAFSKKAAAIRISLKRHADDVDCFYIVNFSKMTQTNESTSYKRKIVRKAVQENANIVVDVDDDYDNDMTEDFHVDLRVGGMVENVNEALRVLNVNIANLIASDTIPFCDITKIPISVWKENNFRILNENPLKLFKQFVEITQKGNGVQFEAQIKSDIVEVKEAVYVLLLKVNTLNTVEYPPEWQDVDKSVMLREVVRNSSEWLGIETEFKKTITDKAISKIERIQNKSIWKTYYDEKMYIQGKRSKVNEMFLWHGTSTIKPHCIYEGDKNGFDYRYSRQGLWGEGCYFAENASYSNKYTHTIEETGENQFLYCRVILGDCTKIESNKSLKLPPPKDPNADPTKLRIDRYDSVEGFTRNSRVFIVYENSKAYPSYLVTYK